MECSSDNHAKVFGINLPEDIIQVTVIALLALSVLLDLVSWKYQRAAASIFYLECVWALFDTMLFAQDYASFPVVFNATRFIAIVVAFGVNARQTIATTLLFSALCHIIVELMTEKEMYDTFGLLRTVTVVFLTVTIFWAQLR